MMPPAYGLTFMKSALSNSGKMKEFESPLPIVPDQEMRIRMQKEYRLIGTFRIWKSMKLWSVNLKTLEVKEEKINREALIDIARMVIFKSKVIHNPECKYLLALNERNAIRKSVQILKSIYKM
jgi:hypothetical protein